MKLSSSKITFFGVSLILIILPLIYIPSVFNPYEFPKFLAFVIATYLLVLFWAIDRYNLHKSCHAELVSASKEIPKQVRDDKKASNLDTVSILIIIFGVVNFIADIIGLDPKISLMGSMWRRQGFLTLMTGISFFFLVRSLNKSEKSFKAPIIISLFSVSLYAIFQGIFFNLLHDSTIPTYLGRIVGTIGNPNSLAGYLFILLPLIFFQKLSSRKATIFLKIVAIALVAAVIIITRSQSTILAGIIIILFFIILALRELLVKIKKLLILFTLAVFLILAFVAFPKIVLINKDRYGQFEFNLVRKGEKSCLINNSEAERVFVNFYMKNFFFLTRKSYCENRVVIWVNGIKAFLKNPILGYGQENYELIFPKNLAMKVDNAHNIFVEVAVSSGLMGLGLFTLIIILAMREATMAIRLSLLAFLIVAQFNPLSIPQIMFFWFLLGLKK